LASPDGRRSSHALTVLRHRDFRLLWFGQLVSTSGQMMQTIALAWHMFELTDSTFNVGLLAFSNFLPYLVLSFVGGAIADQMNRRNVLLVTQAAGMAVALSLVTVTVAGVVTAPMLFVFAVLVGMTRAFDGPARQALIPNLVPRQELASALTLNTMLRQIATTVGPGVGGLLIGVAGVGTAYAVNAVSFIAVFAALLAMRPVAQMPGTGGSRLKMMLGGVRFAMTERIILLLLAFDFFVVILGSTEALMPAFARDILAVGPKGLGLLYGAPAVGAIVGALILGAMGTGWRHVGIVLLVGVVFGLCIIGFGLTTSFALALGFLFVSGLVDVIGEVMRATIIQLRTPDDVRGRVTAMSAIFTGGGPQVGQLNSGIVASFMGPAGAAVFGGIAVLVVTGAFALNPVMRRPVEAEPPALEPAPA
jgi:MFS family permease